MVGIYADECNCSLGRKLIYIYSRVVFNFFYLLFIFLYFNVIIFNFFIIFFTGSNKKENKNFNLFIFVIFY